MPEILEYQPQFTKIFSRNPQLSDIKPSVWAEKNIIIPGGKGRLNYDYNPYCREIIDTMAPDHPAKKIAVMKGSQITFSSGVIMPILGYIIKEDPHNTYLMVGTQELVKMAVEKLDLMIHGAKLGDYINYQIARKKNNKSGDTDEIKSFPLGYIKTGSATNPKSIAQVDLERILLDDFDSMKGQSKAAGSFLDLIEMRAAANLNTYKLMMIGTPLLKHSSNIEPAYLAGDQRRYFVECPCCHDPIILKWTVPTGTVINPLTKDIANGDGGIYYEVNSHNQIIKSTVGYVCYKCAGFFKDTNKQQQLRQAIWTPTAIPISDDYFSYHISSLYAPVGMFDWAYYCDKHNQSIKDGVRDEHKTQVLVNTCFGETYEQLAESPQAKSIMRNTRTYPIGVIPQKQSIADGNGPIVLLTYGSDMNGTRQGVNGAAEDDARLDYEIVAWAASGASYSIKHGSIGTFIPRENTIKNKVDRKKWTYEHNKPNSVWPEFNKVIREIYLGDDGGSFLINMPGLDVGAYSDDAHTFIDWTIGQNPENPVIGVRGNKEEKYVIQGGNLALYTVGKYRNDVYFLQVGVFKDMLANRMSLKWDKGNEDQPAGFMNFPQPSDGLYGLENYFEHYEAEHRVKVEDKDGLVSFRWVKKNTAVQNHMFDCHIYNMAIKEIIVGNLKRDHPDKPKEFLWPDFVKYVLG